MDQPVVLAATDNAEHVNHVGGRGIYIDKQDCPPIVVKFHVVVIGYRCPCLDHACPAVGMVCHQFTVVTPHPLPASIYHHQVVHGAV